MGELKSIKWCCAAVCAVAASFANAAQWVSAGGVVSARGDEVTLVGGAVTARADLVEVPVLAGQTYTLTGQARSSAAGAWTYIGVVNGGVATERGNNASTYTPIAPITFTAKGNTISVYGSFWKGQQGSGYVKAVALNGQALVAPLSEGSGGSSVPQWVSASGTVSMNGEVLVLAAGSAVSRGEIRNVPVTPGKAYVLAGNVYSSSGGYTYVGVVNGTQVLEQGGNWAASKPVAPLSFIAQGSTITVYGSFWTGQTGSGYVHNVTLNGSALTGPTTPAVAAGPCAGTYVLCDDFDGNTIDTSVWTIGNLNIAQQYPVRSENVGLTNHDDNGRRISVVDAKIYGDLHAAAPRQGGLLISKKLMGGGRYEVRMKTLPGPNGCSCFWNYYDSLNEANPPADRVYTEIDIEMPAHMNPAPAWNTWRRTLGFNTWSHTDSDADATYINHPSPTVDPFDGNFHVFRWDWYDGINGSPRIDWYVDGILQATTTQHVGSHPAQLWVGNWPAPWPGMDYNFDTLHLYIDWVRVSVLK
jgi:hypothetical protein